MSDTLSLLKVLSPKASPRPLIRLGGEVDGAYLLPNDLQGIKACFSPGVQNRKRFEDELCEAHSIPCHMCDYSSDVGAFSTPLIPGMQTFRKQWLEPGGKENSVRLEDWIQECCPDPQDDLILQMDIEGAEYRNLLSSNEGVLQRFRIIVMELHGLQAALHKDKFENELAPTLRLLDKYFVCVHTHPNNCCGNFYCKELNEYIPNVLEATFLRRDRFKGFSNEQLIPPMIPHPLDIPFNVWYKPPLHLADNWLGSGHRKATSELKALRDKLDFFEKHQPRLQVQKDKETQELLDFFHQRIQDLHRLATEKQPNPRRTKISSKHAVKDLAEGKLYTLSSVYANQPAIGKVQARAPFFFSTGLEANPRITIDLGARYSLTDLILRNRTDSCWDRARFLFWVVSDTAEPDLNHGEPVYIDEAFWHQASAESRTPLAGKQGRYVTIFSPAKTYLHLSAIRVMGTPARTESTTHAPVDPASYNFCIPYTAIGMSPFIWTVDDVNHRFELIDPSTHSGSYVCFYRVGNVWELNKRIGTPVAAGNENVAIPKKIKSDLRSGKCLLVLDNSNEGHLDPHNNNHLAFLDQLISTLQPHDNSIIFLDQNRHLISCAKSNDPLRRFRGKIQFFCYDYFLKLLMNKQLSTMGEERSAPFPSFEAYLAQKDRLFLCLLGTPRPHRVHLYKHLLQSPLLEEGLVSFPGFATHKSAAAKKSLLDQLTSHPLARRTQKPMTTRSIADLIADLPARHLDTETDTNLNTKAHTIPVDFYNRTFFSLVSETEFESSAMRRITEKSLKSIAMGHPCIILGNSYSLDALSLLGFQLFEDVIDPSYDKITDALTRFDLLLCVFDKTAQKVRTNPRHFAEKIYESSRYNFLYARESLKKRYNELFEIPLLKALEKHLG